MRIFIWLFRAALFFALFAFALNNQQEAAMRWFFGYEWRAPMVFIVLVAFAFGCAFGVFAMVPSWWKHRRVARRQVVEIDSDRNSGPPSSSTALEPLPEHPPRDGL